MAFYTLGIESSCDETAAAVLEGDHRLRANVVFSQADLHARYGGVVPEVASRNHVIKIIPVVQAALEEAGLTLGDINLIGVTRGPGLIGPLLVGLSAAQGLALALELPFVAVNHLEGHLFAHLLSFPEVPPPFLALLVSGGHTNLIYVPEWGRYEVLGSTRDDAAGEAFDKAGKLMGLGYPAGPQVDRLAREGNPKAVAFPRPMLHKGLDFSFSGLKTAVRYYVNYHPQANINDVAASFQAAVVEVLVTKLFAGARQLQIETLVVVGGVAANAGLRQALDRKAAQSQYTICYPALSLCMDNAAMIAACARYRHERLQEQSPLNASAKPALSLAQWNKC